MNTKPAITGLSELSRRRDVLRRKLLHGVTVLSCATGLVASLMATLFVAQAASVPAGFTETLVPGPSGGNWNEAVGVAFDSGGRMFVWERAGRVWFKDPADANFTQLLDISEEVANWGDHGCLGFALDPGFAVNGYIYLLYAVDRHHLLYYGTPTYKATQNEYTAASIGRVTRYTCTAANNFRSVNLASRLVLIGETKTNGIPLLSDTHGMGSLVFGQDGTLLVSCGDGASAWLVDTGGSVSGSFASQALSDGIIRTKENVGGYRAQLVDCLDGKILRIDPATGNGVPSNPYFDAANPRAAKSRVWTVGTRNPFRMSLRPNSGSHDPADGNPGVLYIGNVGWDNWESLKVVTGPAQNLGWPLFEGLELTPDFVVGGTYNVDVANLDAPNPLYPGGGCSQYFSFRQLLKQDSTNAANQPPFNNPCNAGQKIPGTIPQFLHRRPVLDWNHASAITRTPTYDASGAAVASNIGAAGSPVTGTQFSGNCAVGGTWYNANSFPTQYQNTYFMADWGLGLIKNVSFTTNDRPVAVNDFATGGGAIVCMAAHPADGSIYYVSYNYGDAGTVRKISYTGNRTPVAVATADKNFGPGPLTVQFTGSSSSDPDAQPLTYSWNFGDGTPVSTAANPAHTFTPPSSAAAGYTVTLTVTDSGGLSASASLFIVVNDTPPDVTINSPVNGALYSLATNTAFNLAATVFDAESSDAQLAYSWQTILHHNNHDHVVATSTGHTGSTVVEPIGCDGANVLYYRVVLTVTDPAGLATTKEVRLFPNCGTTDTPPTISNIANQSTSLNTPTAAIPFIIGDAQVAAANLQLSAGSSNPALVPANNIVFGGSGANRTVTVTPAPNMNGTATLTVTVNDGPNDVSDTFVLTVTGSNTPPTISSLANQSTLEATPTAANPFTIGDANTSTTNLLLSGFAANPALVPAGNFVFGGVGASRTVSVTPAPGQTGATAITIVVSDGQLSASNSYTLTVSGLAPGTKSFTNATTITVPDVAPASPYPSTINVSGLGGVVSNITVTLRGFNHTWSSDVDVLLVGPGGQKMLLMSDAGTGAPGANANLTFSDSAAAFLPASGSLTTGTYKPTDYAPADSFPSPAPAGPYATNLSVFKNVGANGAWSLYLMDDGPGDTGSFANGWTMTVTTMAVADSQPPTISDIPDQSVALNTPTAALPFTIGDADTAVGNLTLTVASSNPALVPTNNIVFGGSGASRTVTVTPVSGQSGLATITVTVSDGTNSASDSFVLTVGSVSIATRSFTNATSISIPDSGASTPYPSTINVTGLSGTVSNVTVTLRNLTQTWASDVDVLLVGPTGQAMVLMSDCGNGAANNVTLTLSDSAAAALPASGLVSGTFRPTNLTDTSPGGDNYPSPAPAGPYGATLASFRGLVANGTWSLYVFDDGPGDLGSFAGGWSLTVTAVGTSGGGSAAPTITDIPNQSTTVSTPTGAIPFTIADSDTPVASLTLAAGSSNPTLVPTNNIIFGGSGSNRIVTVTPAAGLTGTSTLSVTVSDGTNSATDTFLLTVNAVNTPPTISAVPDQTINEDNSTGPIAFTIGDAETAATSLTLSKASSNSTLVPTNNIVFGGSGSNRTVTVTPALNQIGSATITVTVGDGQYSVSTNFLVTVTAVNDAPTISSIANQTIGIDSTTGPLGFTVGDVETAAGSLLVTADSSNPTLVPTNGIVLSGSNATRTVTVTPAAGQSGAATITLTVSDGQLATNTGFVLTVSSLVVGTRAFTNAATITIPDSGAASLYPSTIVVTNLGGTVSNMTVSLRGLSHARPDDIDVLLVGPGGQKVILVADVGGANIVTNINITLSDTAASGLPNNNRINSGTYRPSNFSPADTFPSPAPASPYAGALSAFTGQAPNGMWSLYVFDDQTGSAGSLAAGWSLTLTTGGASAGRAVTPPGPITITDISFVAPGTVRIAGTGDTGVVYTVETSMDLIQWDALGQTMVDGSGVFEFVDDLAGGAAQQFYRVTLP